MIASRWAEQEAAKDADITAEELIETANRILHRQFISRGDRGGAKHFERAQNHLDFYKQLFATFGYQFLYHDGWGYVGYISPHAFANARVPTQETFLLLIIRYLYDENARKGYFVEGTADILVDEEEIQSALSAFGGKILTASELRQILTTFKRRGLITFDTTYSLRADAEITIRPTILAAIDKGFLHRLEAWRDQPAGGGDAVAESVSEDETHGDEDVAS